jgi:hypothetical protein
LSQPFTQLTRQYNVSSRLVFPVDPMHVVAPKVGANGSADRWKKLFFAEDGKKAKSLKFVFQPDL